MSRIAENRAKMSGMFEKAGTMGLSASKKSLKIVINDPAHMFIETYYVSVRDIQTVLAQPSKVATIVKFKEGDNASI